MSNKNVQKEAEGKKLCVHLNIVFAACIAFLLIFFFLDFFHMSIDGTVENQVSGFGMAFILFGKISSSNILSLVRSNNPGQLGFASVMSLLCLMMLIAMLVIFIYRAVTKKSILSKYVIIVGAVTIFMFILQSIAYGAMTSSVTAKYYADCAAGTCVAQSYNFIVLILLIAFGVFYYLIGERMHTKYGIGFQR